MTDFFKPGADDVIVPEGKQFGWTDGRMNLEEAARREAKALGSLQDELPEVFAAKEPIFLVPAIAEKWDEYQKSKGRGAGSNDLTLIEDFSFGRNYAWEDQFVGSCVISNTFRGWVKRCIAQIALEGESVEYLGLDEFGPGSIAPYAPWSYGQMRRRGGLRRGDGGFCGPMGESLMKDGVLPCSSEKLNTLLARLGHNNERDYPEPVSKSLYREFGDWSYLDELAPDACCPLEDSDWVKNLDDHIRFEDERKPMFQCSGIAIRKVGTHSDGFAIHARDPRNSWAHNMGWQGFFIASDGRRFHRLSNESWGDEVIYNIPSEELEDWYMRRNVSTMTIGRIHLKPSTLSA